MIVTYTNERGFKSKVAVPDGTLPEFYRLGAIIGPPDLSELGLVAANLKKLNNSLVEHGIYDGNTLNRGVIRQILRDLNISLDERWITVIFVREYL